MYGLDADLGCFFVEVGHASISYVLATLVILQHQWSIYICSQERVAELTAELGSTIPCFRV